MKFKKLKLLFMQDVELLFIYLFYLNLILFEL